MNVYVCARECVYVRVYIYIYMFVHDALYYLYGITNRKEPGVDLLTPDCCVYCDLLYCTVPNLHTSYFRKIEAS